MPSVVCFAGGIDAWAGSHIVYCHAGTGRVAWRP